MRILLTVTLVTLTILVLGASPAVAQDYEVIRNVRLRSGPSSAHQNLGTLHVRDRLFDRGLDQRGRYLAVRTIDGEPGWVYAPYVRPIDGGVMDDVDEAPTEPVGDGTLGLHFIDVGQGDSTLIVCPNGRRILVDAGTTSGASSEDARDYVLGQIDPDDPQIDTLVITHADGDHYNLLDDVLDSVGIGHIYHVGDFAHYNASFRRWLRAVPASRRTKLPSTYFDDANEPNSGIDCGDAEVYVLAANIRSGFSWKNTRSIVLMLRFGEFEAILTGDATRDTESVILNRYTTAWLNADLLKMGHHGSSYTSTTQPWANAVRPEVAIASAAWQSEHGHPRREVVQRLEPFTIDWDAHRMSSSTGSRGNYTWHTSNNYRDAIFSTATNGSIVVSTEGDGGYQIEWFDYGS